MAFSSKNWLVHGFLTALLFSALCLQPAHAAPTFSQVRSSFVSSESVLLDRNGEPLHRLRGNPQVRRGEWVALADISPALRTAMVYSEDKRFFEHSGVDWKAVGAAAWGNVWNQKTRGASTLTMQLVGLINDDLRRSAGGRTLLQKVGQAASAHMLDGKWQKSEILEAYLNLVPYRGEMVGIDAVSRTLFGKAAHGLDEREAAIAAALVRAPNATAQAVAQRACGVLAQMQNTARSALLCDSLGLFATGVMQRKAWSPSQGDAPHMAQRLLADKPGGSSVRSTISASLQRHAATQLQQTLHELSGRNVRDGAVLVLDNATGDVLAWVGASASTSAAPQVDYVTALRQPGSTLKPFLYAQALAEKRLTAASLVDDSAAAIPTQSGLYVPQDHDRRFRGWVSVRMALASSLNVPAVRTVGMVGVNRFTAQLKRLGFVLPRPGEHYGYSLALGSAETSLLQLANAFRTLANGGRYSAVRMALDDKTPVAATQVMDPRASFIVSDILSDNNARLATFGNNNVLQTRFWSAVKTGTSKDMRDNWAVGYSQHYTVAVWVGNAQGQAMWDVVGTTGAAPVWAAVMQHLHASVPSQPPAVPAGVVQQRVRFAAPAAGKAPSTGWDSTVEPERMEWFIAGTQQSDFARAALPKAQAARIESPVNGTILALDPDIPPRHQRVLLRTTLTNAQWRINGKAVGSGKTVGWLPWPGQHRLSLHAGNGQVVDEISLEVRGASVKMGPPKHAPAKRAMQR